MPNFSESMISDNSNEKTWGYTRHTIPSAHRTTFDNQSTPRDYENKNNLEDTLGGSFLTTRSEPVTEVETMSRVEETLTAEDTVGGSFITENGQVDNTQMTENISWLDETVQEYGRKKKRVTSPVRDVVQNKVSFLDQPDMPEQNSGNFLIPDVPMPTSLDFAAEPMDPPPTRKRRVELGLDMEDDSFFAKKNAPKRRVAKVVQDQIKKKPREKKIKFRYYRKDFSLPHLFYIIIYTDIKRNYFLALTDLLTFLDFRVFFWTFLATFLPFLKRWAVLALGMFFPVSLKVPL